MTIIEAMVEGGKASAAPPLGPQLGPLGINIGQVISAINEKTAIFKGMQVPVKIDVNDKTKEFTITVGTPPVSQLIIKEAQIEKGSGNPKDEKVADLRIEQIIKIAKMKEDSLTGVGLKNMVKEVIGTCNSMGVLVEGYPAAEAIKHVEAGEFDKEIKAEKTEISAEELKELEEERKRLAEEMKTRRAEFEARAKQIVDSLSGKSDTEIKKKLHEAKIPEEIIKEVLAGAKKAGTQPEATAKKK